MYICFMQLPNKYLQCAGSNILPPPKWLHRRRSICVVIYINIIFNSPHDIQCATYSMLVVLQTCNFLTMMLIFICPHLASHSETELTQNGAKASGVSPSNINAWQ